MRRLVRKNRQLARSVPVLLVAALLAGKAGAGSAARAQEPPRRYELLPDGSTLRIEGTATTGAFTCVAGDVLGHGRFAASGSPGPEAQMAARVRSFDCGKRRMNADFYEALRSAEHPLIRFRLTGARVLEATADGRRLRARGRLELAGAARDVTLTLTGRKLPDGRLRGCGQKELRMSAFGIEPPTALLGLIEVHDRITVRFDLTVAPDTAFAADAPGH